MNLILLIFLISQRLPNWLEPSGITDTLTSMRKEPFNGILVGKDVFVGEDLLSPCLRQMRAGIGECDAAP